MSEDSGFVERPKEFAANGRNPGPSQLARIRETAENGQAVLIKSLGNVAMILRAQGYRVHSSNNGAPKGFRLAWAEKVPPVSTEAAP